jgi:galactose-1-phosphate uridylyltransferase
MRNELAAARAYQEKHGRNFWDDLTASETENKTRFLGKIGRTTWLSSYAPMGVAGDVIAVADGARSTLDLTEEDMRSIADGLVRTMAAYDKIGIFSFNMNFFTGRAEDDFSRFHLVFSPRAFFNQALGTPDIGALRNLFNETICMAFPEDIADMIRPEFTA